MLRTRIYPIAFTPALLLALSAFCLYAITSIGGFSIAMLPLLLAGLGVLCYACYIFPIVTFDHREITILRLFPGRLIRIPWTEVQHISPLEGGNYLTTTGYGCDIHTSQKTYSVFPLSLGFHKLLKYWDTVKPKGERPPLLLDKIPVRNFREPFFKNTGSYLLILIMGLSVWTFSTSIDRHTPLLILLAFVGLFILLAVLLAGPYFNYFEFTPTHFYVHSPFFFWKYKARWENVRAIRLVSTYKTKLVIICNTNYQYRLIIMGDLPPNKIISQLLKANVPIGMG